MAVDTRPEFLPVEGDLYRLVCTSIVTLANDVEAEDDQVELVIVRPRLLTKRSFCRVSRTQCVSVG